MTTPISRQNSKDNLSQDLNNISHDVNKSIANNGKRFQRSSSRSFLGVNKKEHKRTTTF